MAVQIDFDPKQAAAVGFVWELLIALLVPIVLCALGGRWLDRRFGTEPWLTVLSFPAALAIAFKMIRQKAEEMKQELYPSQKPTDTPPHPPTP